MVKRTSSFYAVKAIEGQQVRYPTVSREFTNTPIIAHFKSGKARYYRIKTSARKASRYTIKTSATSYEYAITARVLYGKELNYRLVSKKQRQSSYSIVSKSKNTQLYPVIAPVIRGMELHYPVKTSARKVAFYPITAREKATVLYPLVSTNYIHCKEIKRVELASMNLERDVNMFDFVATTRRQELASMLYKVQIEMLDSTKSTKIQNTNKTLIENEIRATFKEYGVANDVQYFETNATKPHESVLAEFTSFNSKVVNSEIIKEFSTDAEKLKIVNKNHDKATKLVNAQLSEKYNERSTELQETLISEKDNDKLVNNSKIHTAEKVDFDMIVHALTEAVLDADKQVSKRDIKAIVAMREMLSSTQDTYVTNKLSETYGTDLMKIAQAALDIECKTSITNGATGIVNMEHATVTNFVNKAHDFNIKNVNIRNIAAPATNSTLATEVIYYQVSDKQPIFTKVRNVDKVLLSEIDSKVAQPNNRALHSVIEAYSKPNAMRTATSNSETFSNVLDTSAVITKQSFEIKVLDQYSAWTKQVFNLKIVDKNDAYVKKREYSTKIRNQVTATDVKNKNIILGDVIVSEIAHDKIATISRMTVADKNEPIDTDVQEFISSTTSPMTETTVQGLSTSTSSAEQNTNNLKFKAMTTSYDEIIKFVEKTNAINEMSADTKIKEHNISITSQDFNSDVLTHDTATTDKEYAAELKTLSNGAVPSAIDTKLEMNNEATNSEIEASLKRDGTKALIAEIDTNSNEGKIERSTTNIAIDINKSNIERSLTSQDGITQITKIDRSRTEQEMFVTKKTIERGRTNQEFDASTRKIERGRVTQEFETDFKNFERAIFITRDVNIKRFNKAMNIELLTDISEVVGAYKPPKKKNKKKIWLHMGKSSWLPSLKHWKTR